MLGLLNNLSLCNEFNKFNNTGASMLDCIYHMTLKLLSNRVFSVKTLRFCHIYATLLPPSIHNLTKNLQTTSGLLILMHGVISLTDTTYAINIISNELAHLYTIQNLQEEGSVGL